jgi:hypothetical protein
MEMFGLRVMRGAEGLEYEHRGFPATLRRSLKALDSVASRRKAELRDAVLCVALCLLLDPIGATALDIMPLRAFLFCSSVVRRQAKGARLGRTPQM